MKLNITILKTKRGITKNNNTNFLFIFIFLIVGNIRAEKVALFYNTDYIHIAEGNLFAEGSNLKSSLEMLGHEVIIFTDISANTIAETILKSDVIVIPELERKDLFANLEEDAKNVLHNYVANGGGLVICGVVAPNEANSLNALKLLNGLYGFELRADNFSLSGSSDIDATAAAATTFITTPTTLENNNSVAFLTGGFPAGAKRVYQDNGDDENTTVALIPYQEGEIAYLGWGWWNAAPTGDQDNGWLDILEASIDQVACSLPKVRVKNNIKVQLNEDGTATLDELQVDDNSEVCTGEIQFSIYPNQFDCEDVGTQNVLVSVIDKIGRTSTNAVEILVEDPMEYCLSDPGFANVNGFILDEYGDRIDNTELLANSSDFTSVEVTTDGYFDFKELPRLETYRMVPHKDDQPLNGVTTFDLFLIARHILGVKPLDSPYKMMAADVDFSGTITMTDVVILRKFILYLITSFDHEQSWRFIPENHSFNNPLNPLVETLPDSFTIPSLDENMSINFIGMKIGDVNGTADYGNINSGYSDRNSEQETVVLSTDNKKLTTEESYTVEFRTKNTQHLFGWQFSLEYDTESLEFENVTSSVANMENGEWAMNTSQDGLAHVSWTNVTQKSWEAEEAVFTLTFKAKKEAELKDVLKISDRYMKAESYTTDGNVNNLRIQFTSEEEVTTNEIENKFNVYQNYPNPVMDHTTIAFDLPEDAVVTLQIFNTDGRLLKTQHGTFNRGHNKLEQHTKELPAGQLIYTLTTPFGSVSKSMNKVK